MPDQQTQILAFEILGKAIDLPDDERESFALHACDGKASLLEEVQSLIRSHSRAGQFLSAPTLGERDESSDSSDSPLAPSRVGRYRLVKLLGEGGFGSVYVAEQEHPVRRTVAVKIIKPGMDTKQVIARFQAERQALATMDHPNIARVLDAGATDAGRPYFVMELVEGEPITKYADEHRCTIRERLGLFVQVCNAVQHAHTKGIIHRDLKPSNVLVSEIDGVAIPKVIDFGIAKSIAAGPAGGAILTAQLQLLGTPQYMSPEQADGSSDIDTRSDIYSLGVLLYELLVGTTPLESCQPRPRGLAEVQRAVREAGPRRPSSCIASLGSADSIASSRATGAKRLRSMVRGELDWIVLKALEKDRGRRYETAAALAADVQRYLRSEPVSARPATPWYRLRVLVRRNRLAVGSLAAVFLVLLTAAAVSTWALFGMTRARDEADGAKRQALVRVAEGMTLQANAMVALRRWPDAAALYEEAHNEYEQLGPPSFANQLGEWNLARLAPPPIEVWTGHGAVTGVDISPDGKRAVYVDAACNVTVRELVSGRTLAAWKLPGTFCRFVRFSPDGRRLVFDDGSDQFRIWDAETGRPLVVLKSASRPSIRPVFSPTGDRVAAGSPTGAVGVWDAKSGEMCFQPLNANSDPAVGVAFSPDGRRLAVVGHDPGSFRVWDLESRKAIVEKQAAFRPTDVAYSPDGSLIATCGWGGVVELRDAQTGERLATSGPPGHELFGVAFSPDGTMLLCGYERTPRLWDVRPYLPLARRSAAPPAILREVCCFSGHPQALIAVAFSPDGRRVLSCGHDGTVCVWAVPREGPPLADGLPPSLVLPEQKAWHAHDERLDAVLAFSPDGRLLLSGAWDGWLKLWDGHTGRLLKVLGKFQSRTWRGVGRGATFTPDGRFIVSGGWDGTVRLYDPLGTPEREQLTLMSCPSRVRAIALSPDGRAVVAVCEDGTVPTCDLPVVPSAEGLPAKYAAAVRVLARDARAGAVYDAEFCYWPDRPLVLCSREFDPPLAFEWPGGRPVEIRGSSQPIGWVVQPWRARNLMVTTARDNGLHFWPREALQTDPHAQAATEQARAGGRPDLPLGGHGAQIQSVSFDRAGNHMVSSAADYSLKLWDMRARRLLAEPEGINGSTAIFSPDGDRLAGITAVEDRAGMIVLSDLAAPLRRRELSRLADRARAALQSNPDDAAAWQSLGNWYAARGAGDWAVECFDRSRARQTPIIASGNPSLVVANCYWDAGRLDDARQELERLLSASANASERLHLRLCLNAISAELDHGISDLSRALRSNRTLGH